MLTILMGEEMQQAASEATISVPVRKSLIKDKVDGALKEALQYGKEFLEVAAPEDTFLEKYVNYLSEPKYCILLSELCVSEFHNRMEPFYYGESGCEDCLNDFKDFIRIYLTE